MTFPMPVINPFFFAHPAGPVAFIGHSQGAISSGSYTYASAPLTPAAADRLVVVVLSGESVGNYSTTGVSVGGTALTLWSPGRIQLFTTIVTYLEVYYGIVSSGAAPNIVATMTATNASLDVYCCSGLNATPVDQVSKTSASGTSCAINDVETKVGGALIAGIALQTSTGGPTVTEGWTGAGTIVEDSDIDLSTNTHTGAAHIATTAATTTDDFTFTLSASKTFVGGAISFGP
ncbi:hypothetical protein NKH53_13785 [Mesorhizobium australicum]|uniref:hypothetical protein n=1 Tax=Mesorhizobium australicum TaxID=536018 RepID=UPI00333A3F8F